MKKLLFCGVLAAGCCLSASSQSKINNAGRLMLEEYSFQKSAKAEGRTFRSASGVISEEAAVLVSLADGTDAASLGYEVLSSVADMAIIRVPLAEIEDLAARSDVKSVSFGETVAPLMNDARMKSNVDAVHAGTDGLTRGYTGKGVVVGMYDTGTDPNHINFKDEDGNLRVKAVYRVTGSAGNVTVYDTPETIANFTTDNSQESHGTHVMGMMAGSYKGTAEVATINSSSKVTVESAANPYYGVATGADIVMSCGDLTENNILAGVNRIIDYAKAQGKPAVINLSLGDTRGSHDPNSTLSKYYDKLAQDAIICIAAGNDGGSHLTLSRKFGLGNRFFRTFIGTEDSEFPGDGIYCTAEFWSSEATELTGSKLLIYDQFEQSVVYELPIENLLGKSITLAHSKSGRGGNTSADFDRGYGSDSYVTVTSNVDPSTNRYTIGMTCYLTRTASTDNAVHFGVEIRGTGSPTVKGYIMASQNSPNTPAFTSRSISGYIDGDDSETINGMACGKNIISVGAYVSKGNYPLLNGKFAANPGWTSVDAIAPFSSYGSSADGRQLPLVCAPGTAVIASYSTPYVQAKNISKNATSAYVNDGRDNYWGQMAGTSMACPFAAGVIALWLEANPDLNYKDVQDIIAQTSKKDSNVESASQRFGSGKIDALAGLKAALTWTGIEQISADDASDKLIVEQIGDKQFSVFVAGGKGYTAGLYNLQGMKVAQAVADGDNAVIDASDLADGMYVLSVEGSSVRASRKLLVK